MERKILYFFTLICVSFVSLVNCSEKYNYISGCILYSDKSYVEGVDNVTFTCGDTPNPNLFMIHKHSRTYIRCSNRGVYSFWPGIIDFDKCSLYQFDRDFFGRFDNAYRIDISDIGLEKLVPEQFQNSTELEYLIASKNQLTEIPAQLFANLKEIVYIDFSNNKIKQINPLTFANLRSLELLDLSRNEIISLDEYLFKDNSNLTTLDLSHNNLTKLEKHFFDGLFKMKHLILSHNFLKELFTSHETRFGELKLLDLRNNQFSCSFLQIFIKSAESMMMDTPSIRRILPSPFRILSDAKYTSGYNSTEITCPNGSLNNTERSAIEPKLETKIGTATTVTEANNSDADKPLEFNIHGIISESHKETGDNIVVTTTFEFPKKFFSKLLGVL